MTKIVLVVGFILLVVICGPLASIWSLNTLFALAIPYSIETWLAAFVLGAVASGQGITFSGKK